MKTKTLYLVQATCGEYSDRREWPVAAYADEQAAQTHVELATWWAKAYWAKWAGKRYTQAAEEVKKLNPFDPAFDDDYNGPAEYSLAEVPLLKAPPKPGPSA
jgi:hypothetical protein